MNSKNTVVAEFIENPADSDKRCSWADKPTHIYTSSKFFSGQKLVDLLLAIIDHYPNLDSAKVPSLHKFIKGNEYEGKFAELWEASFSDEEITSYLSSISDDSPLVEYDSALSGFNSMINQFKDQ